jgi:murein L,D-transpeptidase YcbB/YkuD
MPFVFSHPAAAALFAGLLTLGGLSGPDAARAQATGAPAVVASPGALASIVIEIPAFRQAVAEAASEDAAISAFYRARDYAPIWTGAEDAPRRQALLSALARAGDHGLPTARYAPEDLRALFAGIRTERDRGFAEVEATRFFLRYARDASSGVVDPARISGQHFKRELPRPDTLAILTAFAEAPPAGFLRGLLPRAPEYARLLRARQQIEAQIAAGGWGPRVTAGSLAPGDTGTQVVALRNRLIAMGYLERSATASYDMRLQSAVQRFQANHGLPADGIATRATVAALNVEPQERLRSIIVALERERWTNIPRGERHIWVNLTDFTSRIVDRDQITFETVSVIGDRDPDKQTPEFSDMMTYMEINPDWTIPRSIVGRQYLAGLQANPNAHSYLQVIDGAGRVVDRSRVNFAAYSARTLPFNLRQPPGPSNPLGKVKFMFPNPWAIYLHDSPARNLFTHDVRAYSSGCVRLKDPDEFAYALLAAQTDDPRGLFDGIYRSGQQTRVYLDDPVPVHLVYRTAFTNIRGEMNYRADIYGRDAQVFDALMRAGVAISRVQG